MQNGDNLYIKFSSTEPVTNQVFSPDVYMPNTLGLESKYKDVYIVDNQGNVNLPQMGKFHVGNYHIQQIKDSIELNIQKYFKQTSVDVRLADNYMTILGEVNRSGRYLFDFRDKVTIFELIGMAGDFTYEADRKEVKLLRKLGNETILVTLDLTKKDVLNSPYYYVFPNDVVMVDPLKAVTFGTKSIPVATTLALILSLTTSILVIISYLK